MKDKDFTIWMKLILMTQLKEFLKGIRPIIRFAKFGLISQGWWNFLYSLVSQEENSEAAEIMPWVRLWGLAPALHLRPRDCGSMPLHVSSFLTSVITYEAVNTFPLLMRRGCVQSPGSHHRHGCREMQFQHHLLSQAEPKQNWEFFKPLNGDLMVQTIHQEE